MYTSDSENIEKHYGSWKGKEHIGKAPLFNANSVQSRNFFIVSKAIQSMIWMYHILEAIK